MRLAAVPYLLIGFRLVAGVSLVVLAATLGDAARYGCAGLLALGVLSDIFDGVIARRIGSVTDRLRTFDSRADVVFWIGAVAATLILHPDLWPAIWPPAAMLAAMEATTHAVSFARFGKEASPHHLLSKLFGLGLWALLSQMIVFGFGGPLLWATFALGVLSQLEALAITLALPAWRCDVRGIREALALRRGEP
jgi:phosphatidylglycerophosphate synthase